ncbi:uncharacterized protein N7496_010728 [Penicillium cataractarum]|uniref:BED-type domain-containing protein n=1 Tax=Penicillium cataractarum TaxID=2100454 RepID=A0A9W9UWZ4_9EURO|nr:uncharacterized protein N7496_010728 [Penicillium cataractarum]KAJ5358315.1 hypothetical protein N7496_010728 [Penicillium cataractarum]
MSQSQVSQFSDNYPSSIFSDTPLDNIPFLPSDSAYQPRKKDFVLWTEMVATIRDGAPKVMCKTCDHTLNHLADGYRGTSSMNKHYSQGVCRKIAPKLKDIRRLI